MVAEISATDVAVAAAALAASGARLGNDGEASPNMDAPPILNDVGRFASVGGFFILTRFAVMDGDCNCECECDGVAGASTLSLS